MAAQESESPASDAQEAEWRATEGERLLVVGIGASAGGLEALERFLQRVLPDSGLAYVVVQHLSPEHESSLADILARAAKLPVVTVTEGTRIERDHVYVIPPGVSLVVEGGALAGRPLRPEGRSPAGELVPDLARGGPARERRRHRALGDGLRRRPRSRAPRGSRSSPRTSTRPLSQRRGEASTRASSSGR